VHPRGQGRADRLHMQLRQQRLRHQLKLDARPRRRADWRIRRLRHDFHLDTLERLRCGQTAGHLQHDRNLLRLYRLAGDKARRDQRCALLRKRLPQPAVWEWAQQLRANSPAPMRRRYRAALHWKGTRRRIGQRLLRGTVLCLRLRPLHEPGLEREGRTCAIRQTR
jgi:hypothetical protein